MAGIISCAAYVPIYRLSRAEIAGAWGAAPGPGERAVANHDEDSITMAVAAALNCLAGFSKEDLDGVYFASTTSPYCEKQAAAVVAGALGLGKNIRTADFAGTLRAGTTALRAALDAVAAGSARHVLVVCADSRLGYPRGGNETAFGDGAAALLIGKAGAALTVEGAWSVSEEFYDSWRPDGERFIRTAEDRFAREAGYTRVLPEAVKAAMQEYGLPARDIAKAAFYGPDPKQHSLAAKKIGLEKTQVQDPLLNDIGNTGCALPLMILAAALEDAGAGDRLLLSAYGDGCDVFILRATDQIDRIRSQRGIKYYLRNKKSIGYMKHLLWKGLLPTEPPARPPQQMVSTPALWRDREWGLALRGVRCRNCGAVQFPRQRVCVWCIAGDRFDPYDFTGRTGKIVSFSHDNLAAAVDPPTTICAVDFPEGGRIMCDMTDRDPEEVKTGLPVEMTFRKIHTVGGIHNYYWKCRPCRE